MCSLRQRLDKILSGAIKHPDLREILKNFQCICEALNCLHKSDPSYVHNDVKPDNILIGDDGRVYLTDFGSAAPADRVIETRADVSVHYLIMYIYSFTVLVVVSYSQ